MGTGLGRIRYVRAVHRQLLDAVSSLRSLSVLLSAVETIRTTQTALVLAWLHIRVCVCRIYYMRLLFEGGLVEGVVYFKK